MILCAKLLCLVRKWTKSAELRPGVLYPLKAVLLLVACPSRACHMCCVLAHCVCCWRFRYIFWQTLITFADSRSGDLKLTPQWRHGAVPEEDVVWVYTYMNKKNVSFLTALQELHRKLFPSGYTPYPFKTGKTSTCATMSLSFSLFYIILGLKKKKLCLPFWPENQERR